MYKTFTHLNFLLRNPVDDTYELEFVWRPPNNLLTMICGGRQNESYVSTTGFRKF